MNFIKLPKYSLIISIFCTCILLISCSSSKALLGDNLNIGLKKGSCFGSCPVYELNIDKTGMVMYNGERFTDKLGKHSLQLGEKKLTELVTTIETMNLSKYDDAYPSKIPDLPSVTISYTNGEFSKTIEGKQERPEAIKELQRTLEEISKMDGYVSLEPVEEKVAESEEEPEEEEKDESIIEGEFIIKFQDKVIISRWMKKWSDYKLTVQKPLDDARKIWVMQYKIDTIEPDALLALLQADEELVSAEFNKKTEKR